MKEEFDFERECIWFGERGFTLCDDGGLRWIPSRVYTLEEQQKLEDELYELSKDNEDTGVPYSIQWKEEVNTCAT